MAYLYADNLSPRDRFTQFEMQLDSGGSAIIRRGETYDLTPNEVSRARRFIVLTPSADVVVQPTEVARLPVVGDLEDGDVPVWDSSIGAFVPGAGGGGGGVGNARVLKWDFDLENYVPAEYRSDTDYPREFVGPIDPETVSDIAGPVFGDRWTPTGTP